MSGYSSKAEAIDVIRDSIPYNAATIGLPTNPRAYNLSGMVRDLVIGRAGEGWGILPEQEAFTAALRRNRRRR